MTCLTVADPSGCVSRLVGARERPRYRLLELLGEHGYYSIGSRVHVEASRLSEDPFQELTVRILVWGGGLREDKGYVGGVVYSEEYMGRQYSFIRGDGDTRTDAVYVRDANWRWMLLEKLPSQLKPLIVIEMSLLWRHSPRELVSLRKQIAAALGVVRRYLWDRHLLLAGIPEGGFEWLRLLMGRGSVSISSLPGDEAAMLRGARRIILLDPSAEKPLTPSEVLEADAFILGGIVDRLPRPGETSRLRLRGLAEPRRLLFHGDVHGVPNRINMLVEILLRARYKYCGDLDQAIRSVMSPRDARLRAAVEIARWSRGKKRTVPWTLYEELCKWLPLTPRDFVRAARMAGLEVEGSPRENEGVQQRPNSSHGQR
ncbi:hypothetical protein [Hyperthermus butylicus]|uniref:Conserved archaeal protein n=1 Tax=Hyperthermus butylicus (strain DSM 5456 / JCM 9403 / PLM1-5) TaxID=415426 RepID=A2BIZ4_HYPBU|nr:hypothetical protein [Hyperthermus butylicus]ABM79955.1 conserved archaeal protein [Hyperthermus butylicus DSM 5456]